MAKFITNKSMQYHDESLNPIKRIVCKKLLVENKIENKILKSM